ncbi:MAG TPA: dTDP-4-dehydrorhamnose reductase, partial [Spirochaetota bacterium]|nr:dTDP-4-dehydrorhamnose reductase [Spirochaetota bacterium]
SWIINCSAYTAVDRAEDEPERAFEINARGVGSLARIAHEKGARLVHISTDYVFDGERGEPYNEDDSTRPTSVYGKSKLMGEEEILKTHPGHFIIRTAWLYGKNGPNFVYTMLRLFNERDEVRVVNDQRGSPTFALDLARAIIKIAVDDSHKYGIYHYTNEGVISWYDFACEIYRLAREYALTKRDVKIIPITSEEYPTRAIRPKDSSLSKEKIKRELGVECRNWKEALEEFLKEFSRG